MRRYLPVGFWIGVRAGLDPYNNINNVKHSHHTDNNVRNDNNASLSPHLVIPNHDAWWVRQRSIRDGDKR